MSIREELELFDGKHTNALEGILLKPRATNSLIRSLVILVGDKEPNIQRGATWLLKRLAENNVPFKPEHLKSLFATLPELTHWVAKLHVCQMLQDVAIPEESTRSLAWFLEQSLWDENKFLRAWAYSGFYELAKQHEKYIEHAMDLLERGEADSAASVRARIRNIREALNRQPRRD